MLECRRIGKPPPPPVPGVPPGELAQDGAIRIFGVIRVLSDSRLLVNVLATRRKLLSLADGELNHPPNIAATELFRAIFSADAVDMDPMLFFLAISSADEVLRCSMRKFGMLNVGM